MLSHESKQWVCEDCLVMSKSAMQAIKKIDGQSNSIGFKGLGNNIVRRSKEMIYNLFLRNRFVEEADARLNLMADEMRDMSARMEAASAKLTSAMQLAEGSLKDESTPMHGGLRHK